MIIITLEKFTLSIMGIGGTVAVTAYVEVHWDRYLGMDKRDSCFLALRVSCSIMSWSTSRAILVAFLILRYC